MYSALGSDHLVLTYFEYCTTCSEQDNYLHMYLYCKESIRWVPSIKIGALLTSRDISKRTSYARTVKAATAINVTTFISTKKWGKLNFSVSRNTLFRYSSTHRS